MVVIDSWGYYRVRALYAEPRLLSSEHDGKQDDMTCIEDRVS